MNIFNLDLVPYAPFSFQRLQIYVKKIRHTNKFINIIAFQSESITNCSDPPDKKQFLY